MVSGPLISIVMPVYNAEKTVDDAIASMLAQTYPHFELILIDDGSTDQSIATCSQFSDPRIRLVQQEHAGIVAALNRGLREAKGLFFARMDADDISLPERLEKQLQVLLDSPDLAGVGCQVALFSDDSITNGMQYYVDWLNSCCCTREMAASRFIEMPIAHPTLFCRTEILRQAGGYRVGDFPEDYELFLRLHQQGCRFGKIPEVLFRWRDHEARLSRQNSAYSPAAFRALKAEYLACGPLDQAEFRIWGAGRDGKLLAKALQCRGRSPQAFIDIDPKKVGNKPHGIPVIAPGALPQDGAITLVCVGTKGARQQICDYLNENGFNAGSHYLCVA